MPIIFEACQEGACKVPWTGALRSFCRLDPLSGGGAALGNGDEL